MNKTIISENTLVTLIKDLDVTELGGDKVMIDFSSGKYYMLKGVANTIWDYIKQPISIEAIKENLLSEFDVDSETCLTSVINFIQQLADNGFVALS